MKRQKTAIYVISAFISVILLLTWAGLYAHGTKVVPFFPEVVWTRTFGGDKDDFGHSVDIAADGGFMLAGKTRLFENTGWAVFLAKTDPSGNLQWSCPLNINGDDVGNCIRRTSDGGYIIAGESKRADGTTTGFLLRIRIGSVPWVREYGENSGFHHVEETSDGGFIAVGYEHMNSTNPTTDVYFVKTDSSGEPNLERRIGTIHWHEKGYCVRQASGGYIITGDTTQPPTDNQPDAPDWNILLLKVNHDGAPEWSRILGVYGYSDAGRCVQETLDGGYIICGSNGESGKLYLIKTDADASNVEWEAELPPGNDRFSSGFCVKQIPYTQCYITVGEVESENGDCDVYVAKVAEGGSLVWDKGIGGSENDGGRSIVIKGSSQYIISGYTCSFGAGGADAYLIRLDDVLQANPRFSGKPKPELSPITRKALLVSHNNYPDPFNPETWIPFKIAMSAPVTIHIYSAVGQLIRTLALGTMEPGMYVTKDRAAYWDGKDKLGNDVSSGIYFYQIMAGDLSTTMRKMVVIR